MSDELPDAIPGAPPGRGGANACRMPVPEKPDVAAIYGSIRRLMVRAHCADSRPHHRCAGAITITRDTVTLNCPRCGDLRKTLENGNGKEDR